MVLITIWWLWLCLLCVFIILTTGIVNCNCYIDNYYYYCKRLQSIIVSSQAPCDHLNKINSSPLAEKQQGSLVHHFPALLWVFLSTCLPLASAWWVRLTLSSLSPNKKSWQHQGSFLGMLRIQLGAARFKARMLSVVPCTAIPPASFKVPILIWIERNVWTVIWIGTGLLKKTLTWHITDVKSNWPLSTTWISRSWQTKPFCEKNKTFNSSPEELIFFSTNPKPFFTISWIGGELSFVVVSLGVCS